MAEQASTPPGHVELAQLDIASCAQGITALLAHLERLGLVHLPRADSEAIRQLANRFEVVPNSVNAPPTTPALHPAIPLPTPSSSNHQSQDPESKASPTGSPQPGPAKHSVTAPRTYSLPTLSVDERTRRLEAARLQVSECFRCKQLAPLRKKVVFGEGSVTPRVVFFGEGPGAEEDRTGRPFVGPAGELLTKMIVACKFAREETYILNTVKCRPPNNRNPLSDEIENCRPFFELQLELLQPEYIVCLGLVAARALLKSEQNVGQMRGKLHHYCSSKVLVTYHPAYLLRNPNAKKAAWEDLQIMLRDMGIDPRAR
jgi:DNA polymerase